MSEQTKLSDNIVVSEGSGYRKFLSFSIGKIRFSRHQPFYLVATSLVVLFLLLWVGLMAWNHHKGTKQGSSVTTQTAKSHQTTASQATTLVNKEGYQAGLTYLDSQIAKTTDKKTEGSLYEDKASLAINHKDYQSALEYAQTAESLNPTANSAELIAESAQLLGDKQLAIEYYKKEIERTPANLDDYTIPGIEARIKQLGG